MIIGLLLIAIGFIFMGYSFISLHRKVVKRISMMGYVPTDGELTNLVRSVVRDRRNTAQANAFAFGIVSSGVGIVVTFIMLVISLF